MSVRNTKNYKTYSHRDYLFLSMSPHVCLLPDNTFLLQVIFHFAKLKNRFFCTVVCFPFVAYIRTWYIAYPMLPLLIEKIMSHFNFPRDIFSIRIPKSSPYFIIISTNLYPYFLYFLFLLYQKIFCRLNSIHYLYTHMYAWIFFIKTIKTTC